MKKLLTCQELMGFIYAYEAGELSKVQVSAFDEHMAVCPECIDYLNTYRKTIELCNKTKEKSQESDIESVPEDLIRAILAVRK